MNVHSIGLTLLKSAAFAVIVLILFPRTTFAQVVIVGACYGILTAGGRQ